MKTVDDRRTAPSPDAEAIHRALGELLRAVQLRDRDRICCYDVSVSQCYALRALVTGGPATLNQLAAALYLEKSSASRVVQGLVEKGYAVRRPHPEDGRAVRLEATAAGRRLQERIEGDLLGEVERLVAGLDPEVRTATARLLSALARAAAERVERGAGCCRLK